MKKYSRLKNFERALIEKRIKETNSIRSIALLIGRNKSTISREIRRNGGLEGYYYLKAQADRNISNRFGFSKIDRNPQLEKYIRIKLDEGWSPEVIAGRWNREQGIIKITHETIYRWIYNQGNYLYKKLPRQKKNRGLKPRRNKLKILNRMSIHNRPEYINDRSEWGHFEADLVFQKGNGSQNIVSLVERKSRMIFLAKNESKKSDVVIKSIDQVIKSTKLPIKTMTFDNGSEFANHSKLGIDTYFCDPGSPWQKGAIENVNGILRRYVDYRVDIELISQEKLDSVALKINSKPRKIHNYLTPIEVLEQLTMRN